MTSQIRVDEITNRSGLGTVTIYDNGFEFTGVSTFTENVDIEGNLTIGGVLTYEDVTNIDSVGVVTARLGIEIGASGAGGTITSAGNAEFVGVVTASSVRAKNAFDLRDADGNIVLFVEDASNDARISNQTQGEDIILRTTPSGGSATERARITSTGNVGINSSSPSARLDVRGNSVITGILTATTFKGDGSQLDGVGGDTDITSSLFT